VSVGHGTELKNRRAKVNNVVQHHQLQQRISRINGYLAAAAVDGGGVDGGVEDLELAVPDRLVAQRPLRTREFFIDNPLVRIHFIIVMIRWTGLAPWEFEFPQALQLTDSNCARNPQLTCHTAVDWTRQREYKEPNQENRHPQPSTLNQHRLTHSTAHEHPS